MTEWQTLLRTGICHAFGEQSEPMMQKAVCGVAFPRSDAGLVEPQESDRRCRLCVRFAELEKK